MNDDLRIFSVDLETSGLDPDRHEILSIGIVDLTIGSRFYKEIYHDDLYVNVDALEINDFDLSQRQNRLSQEIVFDKLEQYMIKQLSWYKNDEKYTPKTAILLGLNPTFDLNFLRAKWGKFLKSDFVFSHRVIDLNSIFVYLDNAFGIPPGHNNHRQYVDKDVKKRILQKEGEGVLVKHNAFNDAIWNVYAWKRCIEILKGCPE